MKHLEHLAAPPPLTDAEVELKLVKESEVLTSCPFDVAQVTQLYVCCDMHAVIVHVTLILICMEKWLPAYI